MNQNANLKKLVQQLAGTYDKDILSFEVATVTAVDLTQWTCTATPVSGDALNSQPGYTDIQLSAELASNGFILVPAVGSNVILAITLRNEIYIFMTSEVDQLIFYRDNGDGTFQSFVINDNGITMGDGRFGGLVKLIDPSDPGGGVLARLNAIEQFMATLQTAINIWTPTPNDGGAALQVALATWLASTPPTTTRSELENTKINHGIPLT